MSEKESLSILVIDDDSGTRSSLRRILKLDGYIIDEADTATSAMQRDDWGRYFAVLLDRNLPDGSAETLLPEIRRLAPEAAILIITGYADLESSIAALRQGAADYLLKPIEPESLRVRLRGLASLRVAQQELTKRDAEIAFMIDNLPAAAAYVDTRFQTVRFNKVIEDITGYTPVELATLDDCFTKLFGERASDIREQYVSNHQTQFEAPLRLTVRNKDSTETVIEFRGFRYDDHEVWLINDVTDRDRYEMELRIRNQAMQSANEGIVITDATLPEQPIIFSNEAFAALSGYSSAETLGRNCELLCGSHSHAESLDRLKEAMSRHANVQTVLQCFRKDGTSFWNEISVAPVLSDEGAVTHTVAVMEDITERLAIEQRILQSERLSAIGEMVTGLAHESRNALQRARACLDMLSLDIRNQEQQELTHKIQKALDDLHRLYEEVRNYAAPINLDRRRINLRDLWRSTWRNLEPLRHGRKFKLTEQDGDVDLICDIDAHRIEQVFRNIMENALSACKDPGELTVTATIGRDIQSEGVRITFLDNGPGFTPESIAGVFHPFFTTKQKGTGLGMSITKRIIDAHGGQIFVNQASHRGAEIIVELPYHRSLN